MLYKYNVGQIAFPKKKNMLAENGQRGSDFITNIA